MKTWKLFLAIAVALVAVLLVTGMVVAAPASSTGVQTSPAFDSPIVTGTVPLTDTVPMTHPVGAAISLFFNIPYTQVMALHDEGFGFGNIARAYLTALASGGVLTPEQVLDLRQAGMGWGQFKKEFGVQPGGNGLGSIMGNKHHDAPPPEPSAPSTPLEVKPGNNGASCPGNSCNAPGHQKPPKSKSPKTH